MRLLGQIEEIEDMLDLFDMVRACDIARNCGVDRWTVSRWKRSREWDSERGGYVRSLPVAHLVVAGVEFWCWPLLARSNPDRFPANAKAGVR